MLVPRGNPLRKVRITRRSMTALTKAKASPAFQAALHIVEELRGRGFRTYFAGGCVRDPADGHHAQRL